MSHILEELRQIISSSKLKLTDQNDLFVFLPVLPEKLLKDLVELFRQNPKYLYEFNKNFRARLDILIDGRDEWDKLIAEEEKVLKQEEEEEEIF
ncbi:hypothetical protein J7J60_02265 [bacterium]|nr:hypothetical protein [bacterium]